MAKKRCLDVLIPCLAMLIGLGLGLLVTAFSGENPWNVFLIIVKSAFGSRYNFGMTVFYATPLIFTGLSVAIAVRAGLFNIGAEGQLTMGALSAAAVGILLPNVPPAVAAILGCAAAILGGALWGAIAGWLRAYRQSHEVITTIMLNFIAAALANYVTLYLLRSSETQNPETKTIGAAYQWAPFAFDGAKLNFAIVIALACAVAVAFLMRRTVLGFSLRATGENPTAAYTAGIAVPRMQLLVMALAGGLAGLVGVNEVLGNSYRFQIGFSADFGFLGIPVALLGNCHPMGVVLAALLFGALQNGTANLDLETNSVTRDITLVIQGFIIAAIVAERIWHYVRTSRRASVGS